MESISAEHQMIFDHIKEHMDLWRDLITSASDLSITRLSGLSNACYRVKLIDTFKPEFKEPRTLLYRRFE